MLKVLAITDKQNTAIDRLAKGVAKYHDNLKYLVVDCHPKRPSHEQLKKIEENLDADIIHFMYFKTAKMIKENFNIKSKTIVDHYNPYSITEGDWNNYDHVVACNESIYEELGKITRSPLSWIPLTVDTDFWTFKREWTPNKNVIMVANRIESKKGILEVAKACKELGLKLTLVGAISDADYAHEVLRDVDFRPSISDEELRDLYWNSTLHVCNSVNNFESGTLPILEAMLTGVPVLTRKIGHVPELYNGENMIINESNPEDVENLKKLLKEAFEDTDKLNSMRQRAWDTAKTRSNERRAYMYQKLYRSVMWPDEKPVSVVMPVYGGYNPQTLKAIVNQDYGNLEIIICNDDVSIESEFISDTDKRLVKYINQPSKGYGLAKQRNLGIIEATGEIIVFCDQRMKMAPDAVRKFVENIAPKRWVYGNKGVKKEFVENFSAIYREDIIKLGMFSERINAYGGMSQYIRSIAKGNGIKLEYIESAKATPLGKSKNKHSKKDEIIKMKNRLWKMNLEQ